MANNEVMTVVIVILANIYWALSVCFLLALNFSALLPSIFISRKQVHLVCPSHGLEKWDSQKLGAWPVATPLGSGRAWADPESSDWSCTFPRRAPAKRWCREWRETQRHRGQWTNPQGVKSCIQNTCYSLSLSKNKYFAKKIVMCDPLCTTRLQKNMNYLTR